MKRLIKSEYVDIVRRLTCDGDYQDITIYKDPIAKEIRDIKNSSKDGMIRGVISNNGVYIWDGNVLHIKLQYPNIDIENGFRFSTGVDEWEFNNGDHTLKEIYDVIIKYKSLLQNMSSFDRKFDIISNEENKDYGTNNHLFGNFSEFEKYIKEKEEVKISRLIKSKFYSAIKIDKNTDNPEEVPEGYYTCFINPTKSELNEITRESGGFRAILNIDNCDLYIFTTEMIHENAYDFFDIPDNGDSDIRIIGNNTRIDMARWDKDYCGTSDSILDEAKKMFGKCKILYDLFPISVLDNLVRETEFYIGNWNDDNYRDENKEFLKFNSVEELLKYNS